MINESTKRNKYFQMKKVVSKCQKKDKFNDDVINSKAEIDTTKNTPNKLQQKPENMTYDMTYAKNSELEKVTTRKDMSKKRENWTMKSSTEHNQNKQHQW